MATPENEELNELYEERVKIEQQYQSVISKLTFGYRKVIDEQQSLAEHAKTLRIAQRSISSAMMAEIAQLKQYTNGEGRQKPLRARTIAALQQEQIRQERAYTEQLKRAIGVIEDRVEAEEEAIRINKKFDDAKLEESKRKYLQILDRSGRELERSLGIGPVFSTIGRTVGDFKEMQSAGQKTALAFTMVAEIISDLQDTLDVTQRKIGTTRGTAFEQMVGAQTEAIKSIVKPGAKVSSEEITDATVAFTREFGTILSPEAARGIAQEAKAIGVTADIFVKARRQFLTVGEVSKTQALYTSAFVNAGLKRSSAFQFAAQNANLVAVAGEKYATSLGRAAASAARIGVSLQKTTSYFDGILDNFEGSLEQAAELRAMGVDIEFNEMARIAATGTPEEQQEALVDLFKRNRSLLENLQRQGLIRRQIQTSFPQFDFDEIIRMARGEPAVRPKEETVKEKSEKELQNTLVKSADTATALASYIMSFFNGIAINTALVRQNTISTLQNTAAVLKFRLTNGFGTTILQDPTKRPTQRTPTGAGSKPMGSGVGLAIGTILAGLAIPYVANKVFGGESEQQLDDFISLPPTKRPPPVQTDATFTPAQVEANSRKLKQMNMALTMAEILHSGTERGYLTGMRGYQHFGKVLTDPRFISSFGGKQQFIPRTVGKNASKFMDPRMKIVRGGLRPVPLIGATIGGGIDATDEYNKGGSAVRSIARGMTSFGGGLLGGFAGFAATANPVGVALGGYAGSELAVKGFDKMFPRPRRTPQITDPIPTMRARINDFVLLPQMNDGVSLPKKPQQAPPPALTEEQKQMNMFLIKYVYNGDYNAAQRDFRFTGQQLPAMTITGKSPKRMSIREFAQSEQGKQQGAYVDRLFGRDYLFTSYEQSYRGLSHPQVVLKTIGQEITGRALVTALPETPSTILYKKFVLDRETSPATEREFSREQLHNLARIIALREMRVSEPIFDPNNTDTINQTGLGPLSRINKPEEALPEYYMGYTDHTFFDRYRKRIGEISTEQNSAFQKHVQQFLGQDWFYALGQFGMTPLPNGGVVINDAFDFNVSNASKTMTEILKETFSGEGTLSKRLQALPPEVYQYSRNLASKTAPPTEQNQIFITISPQMMNAARQEVRAAPVGAVFPHLDDGNYPTMPGKPHKVQDLALPPVAGNLTTPRNKRLEQRDIKVPDVELNNLQEKLNRLFGALNNVKINMDGDAVGKVLFNTSRTIQQNITSATR